MNIIRNTTALGHYLISAHISNEDIALDCTLGNGNDTLALLEMGIKKVIAMDIQQEAIDISKQLILEKAPHLLDSVSFILDSHENLDKYIDEIGLAIFNLGYLPNGDKTKTTQPQTTISAISKALDIMKSNGMCLITMYGGHPTGKEEKKLVLEFVKSLSSKQFHCVYLNMINQPNNPPEIILINKK